MPDEFELSRRKALAALGTVGVASAGAGLGTSAFFSDQETFENNQLTAGTLDMKVSWEEHYSDWSEDEAEHAHMTDGELVVDDRQGFMNATLQEQFPDKRTRRRLDEGTAEPCEVLADVPDDLGRPVIELSDVKPGDFGVVVFDFSLCDNPGFVWLTSRLRAESENGETEPESDDPDEGDGVELPDAIEVHVWYDSNCNGVLDDIELGGQFVENDLDGGPAGLLQGPDTKGPVGIDVTGDGEHEDVTASSEAPPPESGETENPETSDTDGDGDIDSVTVKMGDRDFSEPTAEDVDSDGEAEAVIETSATSKTYTSDIDGDGDPDVVVRGTKSIFKGTLREITGDGPEGRRQRLPGPPAAPGPQPFDPSKDCFTASPTRHCLGVKWELPVDHGNEVQSDSVAFDLGFDTEQCRHNDGSGMNDEPVEPAPEPSITISDQPAGEPP